MKIDAENAALFKTLEGSVPLVLLYQVLFEMTKEEAEAAYQELYREHIWSEAAFVEYTRDQMLAQHRAADAKEEPNEHQ
jgi:hypothetical protein